MALPLQEINLRRLLAKCELLCKSKQNNEEKMPQYVSSLDKIYKELKEMWVLTVKVDQMIYGNVSGIL